MDLSPSRQVIYDPRVYHYHTALVTNYTLDVKLSGLIHCVSHSFKTIERENIISNSIQADYFFFFHFIEL